MACRIPDVAISDGNAPMGGGKQPKGRPAPRRPAARRIGSTRSRRQSGGRPRRCRQLSESSGASAACEEAAQDSRPARRRPKSVDARGEGRRGVRRGDPARGPRPPRASLPALYRPHADPPLSYSASRRYHPGVVRRPPHGSGGKEWPRYRAGTDPARFSVFAMCAVGGS